jgi:hypothetical protein
LITLTILGEEYKPCSSSLCSFFQPPVTSTLLGPIHEGDVTNSNKILVEGMKKGRDHLEDLEVDWKIILKLMSNRV